MNFRYLTGEYPSGGIGELSGSGLIGVAVDDESRDQARSVVEEVAEKLNRNE